MIEKLLVFLKIRKPKNKTIVIVSKGKEIKTNMKSRVKTKIHTFPKHYFDTYSRNLHPIE